MKLLVKTLAGLEPVLEEELRSLGAENIQPLTRAIACEGDRRLLYRANLELRTAVRILTPIATFSVRNEDELYREVRRIDWSQYMTLSDTLAVDAVTNAQGLSHSKYAALKTKDAIVDQFRQETGRRPSVDLTNPSLRVNLHVTGTRGTLSLDTSGDSLHKRGYRVESLAAPINEVLAAGMVLLSGWQRDCTFLDPMCGSGTILIEAALYAYNIPPQLYRRSFGFQRWPDYDADLWNRIVREARERIREDFEYELLGFDRDFRAVKIARHNALAAYLEGKVQIDRQRFERLEPPADTGFIIMNPPYDERLTEKNVEAFYQMIGDRLKQEFSGYEAWIISSNKSAIKNIGLRASKRMTLYNGALECKFLRYELYEGSKKE